ncbi:acetylcholine receptor subunit beta-like [Chamaea fasciata]|uniref:acetylcholine receptor subunit beta-like n=1 Tax=Chamaea fasciata TaxID=190680 RepID=UPI00336A0D05
MAAFSLGAPPTLLLLLLLLLLDSGRGSPGLLRALLAPYRAGVRPGGPGGVPVPVTVGLELAQLVGLDEKNEEMTTKVYLNLSWRDPRLSWEPRDHGGVTALRVPAQHIWLPDVGLDNKYRRNAGILREFFGNFREFFGNFSGILGGNFLGEFFGGFLFGF